MSMLDPKSGTITGALPCGYLDRDGGVHQEYIVREMTGEEEDLLAGKGPILTRLNRVILNCTESLGEITDKQTLNRAVNALTAVDRMVLMVAIRRASIGDEYTLKITCVNPDCRQESHATLNLSQLEIIPMPDPSKRSFETVLASGRVIKWHVMDGRDENWLQGMAKKGQNLLTLQMLSRVNSVDDHILNRESNLGEALRTLKKLRMSERNEIRSLFKEVEGSIDMTMEYECPHCGHTWSGDLDIGQPTFFFPSGM